MYYVITSLISAGRCQNGRVEHKGIMSKFRVGQLLCGTLRTVSCKIRTYRGCTFQYVFAVTVFCGIVIFSGWSVLWKEMRHLCTSCIEEG